MVREKTNSLAWLIFYGILQVLIIVPSAIVVVITPYTFVKVVNLILVIGFSLFLGVIIREIFILKNNENYISQMKSS